MDIKKKRLVFAGIVVLVFALFLGALISNAVYAKVTAKYTNYYIEEIVADENYKNFTISLKNNENTYIVGKNTLSFYADEDSKIKGYVIIEKSQSWLETKPQYRLTSVYLNVWYGRFPIITYA